MWWQELVAKYATVAAVIAATVLLALLIRWIG
jgi:hypothetical protein